jgi:hypothetical protein
MTNYYYFGASLPALSLDEAPTMTYEEFRADCARWLAPRDAAALDQLDEPLHAPARHRFLSAWRRGETRLRNAVVRQRCARRKEDASASLRDDAAIDLYMEQGVADAFGESDPLRRERRLDELRWKLLDELAGANAFTAPAILAYGLKLRIALRWSALDEETGREEVAKIVSKNPNGNKQDLAAGEPEGNPGRRRGRRPDDSIHTRRS